MLRVALLLALSCLIAGLTVAAESADDPAAVARWRAERRESLTADSGWLSLVGLYWFSDGANTFGNGRANSLRLEDPQLGRHAGRFLLDHGRVRFEAERGSCVRVSGAPATSLDLHDDTSGEPTELSCGSLRFHVIARGGKYGLRVSDLASRARREFRGLEFFPADADWSIDARLEPYLPVHHVPIVNVLGMQLDMVSPGAVVFERDGREWRLDALLEGPDADELFIMFADGTAGHETYGGGRFLYVPLAVNGHVALDFNHAHNPPCAFTRFATCPLPPAQNRIALRVTAGELRYGSD